jgi:hypothetical protein
MVSRLKALTFITLFACAGPAGAENAKPAAPPPPSSEISWGWLVVIGSIAAGIGVTTYGLGIDCAEFDDDCHRRAALPIWGGFGVAATGSLIGLQIVESHQGPSGTALTLKTSF